MVRQAEDTLKVSSAEAAQDRDVQRILEKHTKEIATDLETVREQLTKARKELKKTRDDKEALAIELEDAKTDLSTPRAQTCTPRVLLIFFHFVSSVRKDGLVGRAKTDRDRVEQENEDLRKKLDRLKSLRVRIRQHFPDFFLLFHPELFALPALQRVPPDEHIKTEVEELRRKTRLLEEENRRWRLQAEKPYEQEVEPLIAAAVYKERLAAPPPALADKPESKKNPVTDWNEQKRLQKLVERLREKVKAKDLDLERVSRELENAKAEAARATRERDVMAHGSSKLFDGRGDHGSAYVMEELRRRNQSLEAEVSRLRIGSGGAFTNPSGPNSTLEQQLEMRNRHLQDRVDELERIARAGQVRNASLTCPQDTGCQSALAQPGNRTQVTWTPCAEFSTLGHYANAISKAG